MRHCLVAETRAQAGRRIVGSVAVRLSTTWSKPQHFQLWDRTQIPWACPLQPSVSAGKWIRPSQTESERCLHEQATDTCDELVGRADVEECSIVLIEAACSSSEKAAQQSCRTNTR